MYRVSPSSAGIWTQCYASPKYSSLAPEVLPEESSIRDEGIEAHRQAEEYFKTGKKPDIPEVQEYVEYLKSFTDKWEVEKKVTSMGMSGIVDATCVIDTTLHIVDYKHGFRYVEVNDNPQLLIYADGLLDKRIEFVRLHIFQPRAYGHPAARSKTYARQDAERKIKGIFNALGFANASDPKAKVGPHCRYCKARTTCPALRDASTAGLDKVYEYTPGLDIDVTTAETLLEEFNNVKDTLKNITSGLEEFLVSEFRQGKVGNLYSLKESFGNREWAIPVEDVKQMGKGYGISLIEERAISPAKAEKMNKELKKVIGLFTVRKSRGFKLTKDNARKVFNND